MNTDHHPQPNGGQWPRIKALASRVSTEHTVLLTLTLFAVLALKVLVIARGRTSTAVAILQSAPLTTVLVGSFISAAPVAIFAVTSWCTYHILQHDPHRTHLVVVLIAALLVGGYVTPWSAVVAGLAAGYLMWLTRPKNAAARNAKSRLQLARLAVIVLSSLYAAWVFLDAVWVPHESIGLTTQHRPLVGYVLDAGQQWTSVLVSGQRLLVRIPSSTVASRQVCVLASHRSNPLSDEAPSLWQLLGDVLPSLAGTSVPSCPTS